MALADIALEAGRRDPVGRVAANIVEFAEASWGLGLDLYPVQKVILKAHYGIPLDDTTKNVEVSDWKRQNKRWMTEAEYLRYLYDEGRSNIKEVEEGRQRREMVLSVGRRSGKTFLCAAVMAYEVYKLILKENPHAYYGIPKANVIQLISVATGREQAGLLYNEASGHFSSCGFFKSYTANNTQTYAKFQTPEDIKKFGRYTDDPTAKATIKVSFSSCVAKGLRGAGNLVIVLDELAHFNDVGQSDALTVYRAVKPSIGAFAPKDPDDRRIPIGPVEARVLSISSPLGRQGFFYQKFGQGFTGGLESQNLLCIQAPSWEVNPSLSAEFFAEEFATDPDSFFTEFGAEFTDRTRGWLKPEHLLACVDPDLRPRAKAPVRAPHFLGLDISAGLTDGDYCALAVTHLEGDQVVLDHIDRIRAGEGDYEGYDRLSFDDIVKWVYAVSRRFYIESGLFDQWAGQPFEAALHQVGLTQCRSEFFTKTLLSQLFHNFKTLMLEKKLRLFDHPRGEGPDDHAEYIEEMLELQVTQEAKYLIMVEAPNVRGKYDDFGDALVRSVWEATQHIGKQKYIAGSSPRRGVVQQMSPTNLAKAVRKAKQRSRLGGSSPDRQRSTLRRGNSRGRGAPRRGRW